MPARAILSSLAILVLLLPFTAEAKVGVTSCGMTIAGSAELTGDLDCSAYPGHALVLDGSLKLNGFTLTGNATDPAGFSVVDCTGKCRIKITGPGAIVGGSTAVSGGKVVVKKEVVVRDAGAWGVSGADVRIGLAYIHSNGGALAVGPTGGGGVNGGKINVSRSTIANNASYGVNANVRAILTNSNVNGNAVADIRSYEKPKTHDTSCLHSARANLAESWGVCFGD